MKISLLGFVWLACTGSAWTMPHVLTMQGRVMVENVNFSGNGEFKFSIVDTTSDTLQWSNSSIIPASPTHEPTTAISLPVLNGLYTVQLGAAGQQELELGDLDADQLALRIWFSDGVNGFQQLLPDQPLTPVAYALRAASVESPLRVTGTATGTNPEDHIVLIDNQALANSSGLGIRLSGAPDIDSSNNFITFFNGKNRIAGRVEGFSTADCDLLDDIVVRIAAVVGLRLNIFDFHFAIIPNEDWFDPGVLPTFNLTGGQLPSLTIGTDGVLPSLTFTRGSLPAASLVRGTLPTASFSQGSLPKVGFSRGSLPTLSFDDGSLPSLTFSQGSLPTSSLSRGSLPSLSINFFSGSFSFSRGSLPSLTFSQGSLPSASFSPGKLPKATFSRGSLPSLSFDDGSLPSLTFNRGSLPSLTFSPGTLPTATFDGGRFATITLDGGEFPAVSGNIGALPRINDLPIGDIELSLTVDTEVIAALLVEAEADFGFFKSAWTTLMDPVCAALIKAQLAFEGSGVTYESGAGDYAEWLEREQPELGMAAGDVVGVFAGKISHRTAGADQLMVISHRPLVLGNAPQADPGLYEKVAFMGQVPVLVRGAVKRGDFILPSGADDGIGRPVSPADMTRSDYANVVGMAWDESGFFEPKYVRAAVGLHTRGQHALQQESELFTLRQTVSALESELKTARAAQAMILIRLEGLEGSPPATTGLTVSTNPN